MDAKRVEEISQLERLVLEYLREHRQPFAVSALVQALGKAPYTPVELKIAALNLVNQGEVEMSPSWELLFREQKKKSQGRGRVTG